MAMLMDHCDSRLCGAAIYFVEMIQGNTSFYFQVSNNLKCESLICWRCLKSIFRPRNAISHERPGSEV